MVQLKVYPFEGAAVDSCTFLDLYETQPIKLTLSIEDVTSADATSVFSRTFKVPATRDNNEFFQNAWELDGIDFDITIKKPAQILVDGSEFKTGHVRLQKIFTNGDQDKTDYELLFLGETRDFSSAIGELTMCQLTLTDFSWDGLPVNYTDSAEYIGAPGYADVVSSWQAFPQTASPTAGKADGNLLFPLIDHGASYDNSGDVQGGTITLGSNGQDNSFNHQANAISAQRLKPMLRAKRLWDQIFEDTGYTYESNFLDSDQFRHMYLSAFGNNETTSLNVEQAVGQLFEVFENPSGNNDVNNYLYLSNIVFSDPAYSINVPDVGPGSGGSTFTAPGDAQIGGSYYAFEFGAQVDAAIENSDYGYTPVLCFVQLVAISPGGVVNTLQTGNASTGGNWSWAQYDSRNGGYQPQTGDIFKIYVGAVGPYDVSSVDQCYWHCQAAPGDYYPPRDLDCEYQQIDFIKDVITMFRLVMQPAASRPNHFIIEPWQDFIGSGDVLDWSKKLIREKDFVSEPLFNTQSAQIEFTKQEDEDYINKYHQDNNKHAYGWLRFDSQNELLKGKRDIEVTGIAPTPIDQIINYSSTGSHEDFEFILPQIFEVTGEQDQHGQNERLPIKPKSRFLFYNGLIDINNTHSYWFMSDGTGSPNAQQRYPLVSPYEYWPIPATAPGDPAPLNLNFANDTRYFMDPDPGATVYGQIPNTLFQEFWSRYISSLYNKFSRRVTAYFTLNNVDLQTLTFDDVIFIDGKYYRPEKIIDAQIGERTAVKCELITLKDQRPIWRPEPLTGFSIVPQDGDCYGDQGSIQVTTNGTPPFNWAIGDTGVPNGTYNAPVGQAPYIFTIDNVPLGIDTLTVIDTFGRSATASYEIGASTATPVVTTWTETDATDCSPAPCNGAISVAPPTGGTGPYTITWEDSAVSGFNPTGLCPNDYRFYITDSNGCQSQVYEAAVSCSVTQTYYELRELLDNCTRVSAETYIADYPGQLSQGDIVTLQERRGCYEVYGAIVAAPQYTINNTYVDCEACNGGPTANSWLIRNCEDPLDERYLNYEDYNLQPGNVVTIQEPGNDDCYEVIEASTVDMDWDADDIFTDCATCLGTDPGFQYYAVFCDGLTPPYHFHSNIILQLNDVVTVLNGPFIGRCVRIVAKNPGVTTFGDLDTSTIYIDCDDCEGIDPQTCTTVNVTVAGAEISYVLNGSTFTESLLAGSYQRCGSNFQVISGSATFGIGTTACTSSFDCRLTFKTTCHSLYGGTTGSEIEYQDANGQFRVETINPFIIAERCAVQNSVTVISGDGSFVNNGTGCTSSITCDGPTEDCQGYEIENEGTVNGTYKWIDCVDGQSQIANLAAGQVVTICSRKPPKVTIGLVVSLSLLICPT